LLLQGPKNNYFSDANEKKNCRKEYHFYTSASEFRINACDFPKLQQQQKYRENAKKISGRFPARPSLPSTHIHPGECRIRVASRRKTKKINTTPIFPDTHTQISRVLLF
jgi:hypothetical protein